MKKLLYSLLLHKEQKVEDVSVWEGSDCRWKLQWRRDRFK